MKNILCLLLLVAPMFMMAQSKLPQPSTEKFIRIVGLAEKVVTADNMKIEFTLSEIKGNEYQKIYPKTLEEVRNDFQAALKANGIDASKIVADKLKNISKSKYNKVSSENYYVMVNSEDEALKISQMNLDGFQIQNVNYEFPSDFSELQDEMAIAAIKDAKRKAENIAKAVGKKVGNILNIEDVKNVSLKPSARYGSKTDTKTLRYQVNVTFELD